ncbi:hypothetical protein, partial [Novosphingobium sp. PASSN1]|uniref:hypothetical protein n=1 Tax=Novosphingobium sp. PASSN1 TaxID=2015561 RepID=UPI000BCCC2A6
ANITQKLIDSNMLPEAQAVWRGNCSTSNSLAFDGGFDQLDTTVATRGFDWQLSSRGDVDVVPTNDSAGNRQLDIEVSAPRTLPVLSQLVVLKPGNYRLTWNTPDTDAAKARALQVTLDCTANLSRAVGGMAVTGKPGMWTQDFTVDRTCQAQRLVFWLPPRTPIRLDEVVLTPL